MTAHRFTIYPDQELHRLTHEGICGCIMACQCQSATGSLNMESVRKIQLKLGLIEMEIRYAMK